MDLLNLLLIKISMPRLNTKVDYLAAKNCV